MKRVALPIALVVAAVLQIVPPLVFPLRTLKGLSPAIWGAVVVVFILLGFSMLRRREWSRVASIFVQGFSILVRMLYIIGHMTVGGKSGNPIDVPNVVATVISIGLSSLVLYALDRPDVQLAMAQQSS